MFNIVLYRPDYFSRRYLSLEALAAFTGVHPDIIKRYADFGLIDVVEGSEPGIFFSYSAACRVRTIERLRREMGINLAGIGVIFELVDRIQQLQWEIERLHNRV